jgi:DNA-directed RNA polymerase subunit RPC12/RpoP
LREEFAGSEGWLCARCDASLTPAKAKLNYLNKDFETDLMACPVCGKPFIGEALALGKMLEVERSLEDK